jgi:hypothetical protein
VNSEEEAIELVEAKYPNAVFSDADDHGNFNAWASELDRFLDSAGNRIIAHIFCHALDYPGEPDQ